MPGQPAWGSVWIVVLRTGAVMAAIVGALGIGAYCATVIPLFIKNAPDKSLAYWYLIFLFGGILALRAAVFLWRISRR